MAHRVDHDPPAPPPRRRRSSADDPLRKLTIRLPSSVAARVKALVEAGHASSTDAFIGGALVARLKEIRRDQVFGAYAAAAADPAFMADHEATARAFDSTIADGLTGGQG